MTARSVGRGPVARLPDRHGRIVRRFATAGAAGDVEALRELLAADAVVVCDGGGRVPAAQRPLHGAEVVAPFVAALLARQCGAVLTAEAVNGRTGLVVRRAGRAVGVVSLSVVGSEITAAWIVLNPDKLRAWHRD
jgi:RNA polymerase sigma-70 factor (ECF subfamily)